MPLFDPESGKLIDPSALRSIQFQGQGMRVPASYIDHARDAKVVEAIREDDGSTAGAHVHHADGRVDAIATPPPVGTKADTTS